MASWATGVSSSRGWLQVRHQGDLAARAIDLFEQAHQIVGVGIGQETVGPVRGGLGADPDADDVIEVGGEQRLDVFPQDGGPHDHRIAAGEQHALHLAVRAKVRDERFRFAVREFQLVDADELRPTEAIGAVGVAGLALAREEENCLAVLVLKSRERASVEGRDVELHLAGRMRVQPLLDLSRRRAHPCLVGADPDEVNHPRHVLPGEHPGLRERQLVDRVFGDVVPPDEILDDVVVDPERQHGGNGLHRDEVVRVEPPELRDGVDVPPRVGAVLHGRCAHLAHHGDSFLR